MSIDHRVIENMESRKLHTYLLPQSKYLAEAIAIAFETLKSRGVEFSEAETARINNLIEAKQAKESKPRRHTIDTVNLTYSIIYSIITCYFLYDMHQDQSSSIKYLYTFPIFWLVSGIITAMLIKTKSISLAHTINKLIFAFSTPIPLILCVYLSQ